MPAPEAEHRSLRLLENLGVLSLARARVRRLSGGEMQRVAIARALVTEPSLILADEPTAHLDRSNALSLLQQLSTLRDQGRALLIATHDQRVLANLPVDHVFLMEDGRIREGGAGK